MTIFGSDAYLLGGLSGVNGLLGGGYGYVNNQGLSGRYSRYGYGGLALNTNRCIDEAQRNTRSSIEAMNVRLQQEALDVVRCCCVSYRPEPFIDPIAAIREEFGIEIASIRGGLIRRIKKKTYLFFLNMGGGNYRC